jgi:outer membrane protein OmpA-like peptidoglycan-associated protein
MASPLSFDATENFRRKLLNRNLEPYGVTGAFSPKSRPGSGELVLTDLPVFDSLSVEQIGDQQEDLLVVLNKYGPEDVVGFGDIVDINKNKGTQSNQGNYDYFASEPPKTTQQSITDAFIKNEYGPEDGWGNPISIQDIQNVITNRQDYYTFIASSYSPYQILLNNDPQGDNGRLSQDSDLAKIGAESLKDEFNYRAALEFEQQTKGRVNINLNDPTRTDPFRVLGIASGRIPIIERDWKISVPDSIVGKGLDFLSRIGGVTAPFSFIPGDYFGEPEKKVGLEQNIPFINNLFQRNNLIGSALNSLNILTEKDAESASQTFLDNSGGGQVSSLFNNLQYNLFRPNYNVDFVESLSIPTAPGAYYVGRTDSKVRNIIFPSDGMPRNQFGQQVQAPVYGYGALGLDYETQGQNSLNVFKFGLGSIPLFESSGYFPERTEKPSGGITGGFVWTDDEDGGLGKRPGPTNDDPQQEIDNSWISTKSTFGTKRSSSFTFTPGSILDDTQKLVDASKGLSGDKKLQHAGNAINQVSKIFSDGYNIMSKGSRVIRYTDVDGYESGYEYCRIFTKDTPFYEMSDLQKTDGNIRQSTFSIFDNTYNLNIAPYRGDDSTNLTGNDFDANGVKKYMFSLENLAWRTSNREGLTYDDLANCEKGPNGGRIMWFPPYDIRVDESVSTRWTANEFLGRPEPIYTYNNTTRVGNLSWKIVVDHPSIMNLIIDKELKGQNLSKINAVVDSFIAGCLKYDIYELVGKYPQFRPNDIYKVVNAIKTQEEFRELSGLTTWTKVTPIPPEKDEFDELKDEVYAVYFHNDEPGSKRKTTVSPVDYEQSWQSYLELLKTYPDEAFNRDKTGVSEFIPTMTNSYDKTKDFMTKVANALDAGKIVTLDLLGSASADMSNEYNINLGKRRIDSVKKWIFGLKSSEKKLTLESYYNNKKLILKEDAQGETVTDAGGIPVTDISGKTVDCSVQQQGPNPPRIEEWNNKCNVTIMRTITSKLGPARRAELKCRNVTQNDQVTTGGVNAATKESEVPTSQELFNIEYGDFLPSDVISQTYSQSAMACRRVRVKVNNVTDPNREEQEPQYKTETGTTVTVDTVTDTTETRTRESRLRTDIAKRVLRRTLTECDYFEVMKEDTPVAYDSIKEKFKYFQPAFHSITPEGLNSRLTFLQQCMRPGDTIPTIQRDSDGRVTKVFNDAFNTAFGAPPVCILRLGDFYHSKIVINSLNIRYEPLIYDINPEGIGVQPMIADVSISFNFIGGEGLKEPVAKLQNALSFNYYANTEMYDDRADTTEDFQSRFDAQILEAIQNELDVARPINSFPLERDGGNTIGFVESKTTAIETGVVTGVTNYQQISKDLVANTKSTVEIVSTSLQKINENFNYAALKMFVRDRNFSTGVIGQDITQLYGKTQNTEDLIDNLFSTISQEIDNGTSPLMDSFLYFQKYGPSVQKSFKKALKKVCLTEQSRFLTEFAKTIQDMSPDQLKLVADIDRLNVVFTESNGANTGSDGYTTKPGNTVLYSITGTTEVDPVSTGSPSDTLQELKNDVGIVSQDLDEFNEKMISYGLITFGGNEYNIQYDFACVPPQQKYQDLDFKDKKFVPSFTALGRYIMDKPDDFANQVVLNMVFPDKSQAPKFEKKYTEYIREISTAFKTVQQASVDSFNEFFNKYYNNKFGEYNPYGNLDKTRKFTFKTFTDTTISNQLLQLYSQQNSGDNNTYNGKKTFK